MKNILRVARGAWRGIRNSQLLSMFAVPAAVVFLLSMIVITLVGPVVIARDFMYLGFPALLVCVFIGGLVAVYVSSDDNNLGNFWGGWLGGVIGMWTALLVLLILIS